MCIDRLCNIFQGEFRYGIKSTRLMYSHPTVFVACCMVLVMAVIMVKDQADQWIWWLAFLKIEEGMREIYFYWTSGSSQEALRNVGAGHEGSCIYLLYNLTKFIYVIWDMYPLFMFVSRNQLVRH